MKKTDTESQNSQSNKGGHMYKLITHTDLDGAGCAVLAKLAWGDNVDITYVHNPDEATVEIDKYFTNKEYRKYNKLYITDMSFNAALCEKHKEINALGKLFDHHGTAVEPFKNYEWATVQVTLNDKLTCGTELFYQYLLKKGLIRNRDFFVEQIRLFDTWDWSKGTSKLPKYLSNVVIEIGLQYFVRTFTERLKMNDLNELTLLNEEERTILNHSEKQEAKDIEYFLKQTHIVNLKTKDEGELTIGWVCNNSMYTSLLGNTICREFDVDIAVMINANRNKIEVRTTRENINLGRIMKTYFSGGGHPKAAGGNIDVTEAMIRTSLANLGTVTEIVKPVE